jgi:hypothetical protein
VVTDSIAALVAAIVVARQWMSHRQRDREPEEA